MLSKVAYAWSRLGIILPHIRRGLVFGLCPICERYTAFYKEASWLRDHFKCARCFSIPRWRALICVLERFFPEWRQMAIHESSPGGAASDKIARECENYVQTHWFPDNSPGQLKDGFRSENLEDQTFPDGSFDLVITQDVFEHVLEPACAFAEVARTLKPGGAHVFTIPWFYWKPTFVRAKRNPDGLVSHLAEPDYHKNPIDSKGSLVVTEWGSDFCDFVYRCSGLTTTAVQIHDRHRGLEAKLNDVFISRKDILGGQTPIPKGGDENLTDIFSRGTQLPFC